MKYTIKKTTDTSRLITVNLDAADLTPIKKNTLARLAKKMKVAGFRPGKVPIGVAEKQVDPNLLNSELLEDAVNKTALEIMESEDITPLDRPKVDVKKYVANQELEYTAQLDVIPDITLGDYKKLKAKLEPIIVTDQDITDVIERMRRGMAAKNDVTRPAKDGDEVTIDFAGRDKDNKDVPGASGKDYPLVIGSGSFIPGFEEGLVGKKVGESFDLPLTFPKDYHHKPLAGAKVTFAVTITAVKEVVLPKLDKDFAAAAGPFKTMADLTTDVKRELTLQKERESHDKLRDQLIEQLVKVSKVPVPEVLVSDQIESLERDFLQNLMYRSMTFDQFLDEQKLTKDQWRDKELRESAIRRVQVGLVLSQLSKIEKIEVTQAELEARLQEMLQYYKDPTMRAQFDTPEARRDIANRVLTEKTVDRLVELNTKTATK